MAHGSPIPEEVPRTSTGAVTTTRPVETGWFDPQTGDPLSPSDLTRYAIVKNAQGVMHTVNRVRDDLSGEEFFEFNIADPSLLRELGFLPQSGGTGRAPPSFGSTQAAQTQAETFAREQAALLAAAREEELAEDARQREIDRELRLREARLTTARDLINIKSAEARESRTQGVQLAGEDPFKFTAIARGLAGPTGTTPSAGFKQNLAQAGSFQAPDLAGLDSAALESVIAKLSQLNLSPQQPFGFAHGGTLSPSGAQSGTGAQAVPVGENGPEIMILRPDGSVEIVPMTRGAQGGGVFDFGGFGSLFSSLRRASGTGGGFLTTPGLGGNTIGLNDILNPSQASALGARQRGLGSFVSTPGQPVFMVTATGLRPISNPDVLRALGGNLANVESLTSGQFGRLKAGFGIGADFRDEGAAGSFRPQRATGEFGAFGQPLTTFQGQRDLAAAVPGFSVQDADRISQLIGFLPAPFKIPVSFFQTLGPTEQNVLIKAYELAGVPEADFRHLRTAGQLSFNPQRATAVG